MARMTEAEWTTSNDSYRALKPCRKIIRYHPRKGRLFAVACCYRIWNRLTDERSRKAVETAALHAEGLATDHQLQAAEARASVAHADAYRLRGKAGACPEWAAQFAASLDAWFAATRASNFAYVAAGDPVSEPGPEKKVQADLARCIFGPLPFRPVAPDPVWLAANVKQLAQGIYADRAFDRLPLLADALEEAGCTDADILAHCRGPSPHVRGCWVVDLILGKQ
jgi:hypothetical protein